MMDCFASTRANAVIGCGDTWRFVADLASCRLESEGAVKSMGKFSKIRHKILSGSSDTNIEFVVLCQLLLRLGFDERVRGSHHIFTRNGVSEILNLQPKGSSAKPYQVKQVRTILVKYRLGETDVD